ncbi:divalent cation tolerance protein CutA [Streptomyces sp. MB09-01]|uniref:divalent cation tolerance protein CutA n=1 Tax=Streptomyces sp. MB09-01 TaxID=3028666 RepID=UPI0029A57485|nr:divalent cation tolerance protein CutA [Streptomyces sp. MB09-01]MDX3536509.1 divalent cation tolerance protein CutA [Streptomyces sp. MB09-01]
MGPRPGDRAPTRPWVGSGQPDRGGPAWAKGAVQHEREYRLSFQTTTEKAAALKAWVLQQHPHDVPQWIVGPIVEASEEYLAWAVQETTAQ